MTETEKTKIIDMICELRAALPVRGTMPEDLVPFRLLEAIRREIVTGP
jgi:hypothetical protein